MPRLFIGNKRPQGDSNPCYQNENLVSWASLDDGDILLIKIAFPKITRSPLALNVQVRIRDELDVHPRYGRWGHVTYENQIVNYTDLKRKTKRKPLPSPSTRKNKNPRTALPLARRTVRYTDQAAALI